MHESGVICLLLQQRSQNSKFAPKIQEIITILYNFQFNKFTYVLAELELNFQTSFHKIHGKKTMPKS